MMSRPVLALGALLALWVNAPSGAAQAAARNARLQSASDTGLRIVISVAERRLRVLDGAQDTLLVARAAVGSGGSISYSGHRWTFDTPRGVRTVIAKDSAPMWVPPDWHYVEVARREHLKIAWLRGDTTVTFDDGSKLVVDGATARFMGDSVADEFRTGEHIIVDDVLFVPPVGSANRKIPGELGEFRLSIGNGVGIHGTNDAASVGRAVTHGCIRLSDSDIAWLYRHVPVGTHVYIY